MKNTKESRFLSEELLTTFVSANENIAKVPFHVRELFEENVKKTYEIEMELTNFNLNFERELEKKKKRVEQLEEKVKIEYDTLLKKLEIQQQEIINYYRSLPLKLSLIKNKARRDRLAWLFFWKKFRVWFKEFFFGSRSDNKFINNNLLNLKENHYEEFKTEFEPTKKTISEIQNKKEILSLDNQIKIEDVEILKF